jgi:hypothetical protein
MLYKGLTIKIEQDTDADSPREWDNLGTMVCFHKRYELGDKKHGYSSGDFSSWQDLEESIRSDHGQDTIILPLYLYDHSGLTISTKPFSCPWDSGQVGFIFAPIHVVKQEYVNAAMTPEEKEQAAEGVLRCEVETYNQFLQGEVYGYTVEDSNGNHLDSCWGFYGLTYCEEQAREAAEYCVKEQTKAICPL